MDELFCFGVERPTRMNLFEVRREVFVRPEVERTLGQIWHSQKTTTTARARRSAKDRGGTAHECPRLHSVRSPSNGILHLATMRRSFRTCAATSIADPTASTRRRCDWTSERGRARRAADR